MRKTEMLEYLQTRFDRISKVFPDITFLKFPEAAMHATDVKECYKWMRALSTGPWKTFILLWNRHPPEHWEDLDTREHVYEEVKIMKKARHLARTAITTHKLRPLILRKSYGKLKKGEGSAKPDRQASEGN